MPSPTPVKCRGPVVRQLSLQSPLHPMGFLKLKKQLSQDDARILDPVEVTGQAWPTVERSDSSIRVGFGEGKLGQPRVSGGRPKPAKVAWADKKPDSLDCPLGVEVIATKCQGQPRPLSIKTQRFRSPLIGNKDTLAYSRLQLAERLRNAWSERERTKPNINIFLAHGSDGTQSDNLSSDRQENTSTLSDTIERMRRPLQVRAFSQEFSPSNLYQDMLDIPQFGRKVDDDCVKKEDEEEANVDGSVIRDSSVEDSRRGQELNRIEIRVTKPEDLDGGDYSGDKENAEADEGKETSEVVRPAVMSAKERRACFRTSSILNKAITESFSLPNEEEKTSGDVLEPGKKSPPKKILVRALSAPSHDQSYEKPTPVQKTVKFLPQKRLQSVVMFSSNDMTTEEKTILRDRIKSAPIRRKLKSAAARRKNKEKEDSSEEEDEAKETSNRSKKTTKRGNLKNGTDIITMVSLVSPAESETEDSVITLPIEESIGRENHQKEETTVQAKTAGQEPAKGVSFDIQKFVTLRKTSKTVTFQTNPVLTRNYSASFPSRRAPAGTPIIIPPPVISNPALTPAQLQERDKRPPVFTGTDGRGVKRRLIRSTSEPVKDRKRDKWYDRGFFFYSREDTFEDKTKPRPAPSIFGNEFDGFNSELTENCKADESQDGEPQFKCPKEKECWALYKRMLAKGVSVTFDTVLRGMLTPTEYRLKKNRLLSTC